MGDTLLPHKIFFCTAPNLNSLFLVLILDIFFFQKSIRFLLAMKLFTAVSFLLHLPTTQGFVLQQQSHPRALARRNVSTSSTSTYNDVSTSNFADRVRNAGCGIPLVSSGNCLLFDPEEEGMLQGTGVLRDRMEMRHHYFFTPPQVVHAMSDNEDVTAVQEKVEAQHWLEHLDKDLKTNEPIEPPVNFAKAQKPVTATVLAQAKIIGDDAPGDIRHVIMKLPEGFHYVEGQSLSVIPPGTDSKGKKHKPRLYSIASTRYGDLVDGNTVSLCVRRAEYFDPVTGVKDDSKKGVCSNFLCDATPNTQVQVAGPVGKTMLLPSDPSTDVIMVATGTGIAPFRGFMHRLFMENTVARHLFTGTAWLILGVPTTSGLLYQDEFNAMQNNSSNVSSSGALKINYAISREMTNMNGGKYYVQDVIAENADEIFQRLNNGANMYFCGLKGMMPSILDTLQRVALDRGVDWDQMLKKLKDNHQWHVEVY